MRKVWESHGKGMDKVWQPGFFLRGIVIWADKKGKTAKGRKFFFVPTI